LKIVFRYLTEKAQVIYIAVFTTKVYKEKKRSSFKYDKLLPTLQGCSQDFTFRNPIDRNKILKFFRSQVQDRDR